MSCVSPGRVLVQVKEELPKTQCTAGRSGLVVLRFDYAIVPGFDLAGKAIPQCFGFGPGLISDYLPNCAAREVASFEMNSSVSPRETGLIRRLREGPPLQRDRT